MKHYIGSNKEIFAFEDDGSQDHLITDEMKPVEIPDKHSSLWIVDYDAGIIIVDQSKEVERAKSIVKKQIEAQRKLDEEKGVTVNGVRYAGDPSNRQALSEVLDLAEATGMTTISAWKDSDGVFHSDQPVADIRQALLDIAARRGELIAQEGSLAAKVAAAETVEAVEAISWE